MSTRTKHASPAPEPDVVAKILRDIDEQEHVYRSAVIRKRSPRHSKKARD